MGILDALVASWAHFSASFSTSFISLVGLALFSRVQAMKLFVDVLAVGTCQSVMALLGFRLPCRDAPFELDPKQRGSWTGMENDPSGCWE